MREDSQLRSVPLHRIRQFTVQEVSVKWWTILLSACGIFLSPAYAYLQSFDEYFEDRVMRVDYYHTGNAREEHCNLDRIYEEKYWGGSRRNLIDHTGLGKYMLRIYDEETRALIFSRGFASIYGEWETTEEARDGVVRTFHESALFPYPRRSIRFVIERRDTQSQFVEIFSCLVDPAAPSVNREDHGQGYRAEKFISHGDPSEKVDLLIVGDGYTKKEHSRFEDDVERFTCTLFSVSPFKERKDDFNVWTIALVSRDSGIDEPLEGFWRSTALGTSFNSLDTPRYVLTLENRALRDIASNAPYDQIFILLNTDRYGGGGIFNLFSTCMRGATEKSHSWWPEYVFVHEFGHTFAGLADEYYSSEVSYTDFYPAGVEPWEPNVTALLEGESLKWGHLIEEGTPVPTPWEKVLYDSLTTARGDLDKESDNYEAEIERIDQELTKILKEGKYAGQAGAFEGAGYASEGLYRPALDCRMFTKSLAPFCPVCAEAIERMIDFHTE
jgi:hypothetical protein